MVSSGRPGRAARLKKSSPRPLGVSFAAKIFALGDLSRFSACAAVRWLCLCVLGWGLGSLLVWGWVWLGLGFWVGSWFRLWVWVVFWVRFWVVSSVFFLDRSAGWLWKKHGSVFFGF
jgi:hypothetical protein